MGAPPSDVDGNHDTLSDSRPTPTVTSVGALGLDSVVTPGEGLEGADVPTALVAVTTNV